MGQGGDVDRCGIWEGHWTCFMVCQPKGVAPADLPNFTEVENLSTAKWTDLYKGLH